MKDLTNLLTVFVIIAGQDPNEKTCLLALKNQTCGFTLNVIRNYMPLSKAFQEMLNRCKTPYFIQCDVDMILNRNAVEKMYDEIEGNMSNPNTAMHCYLLKDVHLNKDIYGIKIYKYDIFVKYPFNVKHPSCEVEQLDRMKLDGYIHEIREELVGEHSPHWTNESIFERYYNLMEKFKIYKYIWMERLPKTLWDKVKKNPTDLNINALAGALASIYSDKTMDKEKDKRLKNKDYGRLLGFLENPHQVTLYMTSNCNYHCNFCLRQHDKIEKADEMTPEMVDNIMAKFPEINGYCLCGFGDPILSTHLIPVLEKLKAANKFVGIITNGSTLHHKMNKIRGWYKPDYISVSLNCHNQEEHEKTTGTETWKRVLSNIKLLVASPIEAYVSAVVTKENKKYIPELIKLVHGLGVKTLHLHNLLPHFNGDGEEWFLANVLTSVDIKEIETWKRLPEASIVKIYPTVVEPNNSCGTCCFPWYSFAVNGNGSLSFCNSVLPCDAKWGNIKDFVVWNSDIAQKFRDDFSNGKIEPCKSCFRNWTWI